MQIFGGAAARSGWFMPIRFCAANRTGNANLTLTFQRWKHPRWRQRNQVLESDMQLRIENMTCGGCVRGVTKAIQSVDPAAQVAADPDMRMVVVTTQSADRDVLGALEKVGFPAVKM